jgi:hypothetical protein
MPGEMRADLVGGCLPTPTVLPVVDSATQHSGFCQAVPRCPLRQPCLIHFHQLGSLSDAQPRMAYLLARLPHQAEHTALGDAVAAAKLGGGRPRHVLGDQAIDCLSFKPPAYPPLPPTAHTPSRPRWQRARHIRQQRGVQFESPQADQWNAYQIHICNRSLRDRLHRSPRDRLAGMAKHSYDHARMYI